MTLALFKYIYYKKTSTLCQQVISESRTPKTELPCNKKKLLVQSLLIHVEILNYYIYIFKNSLTKILSKLTLLPLVHGFLRRTPVARLKFCRNDSLCDYYNFLTDPTERRTNFKIDILAIFYFHIQLNVYTIFQIYIWW